MRERLTGAIAILYTLIMIVFSLATMSLANGQYINKKAEKLPDFAYVTLDGNKFTKADLKPNAQLLIVYFNPSCEICQKEAQDIVDNISFFSDIQIVMISPNAKDELIKFREDFNLSQHKQITMLHDPSDLFYKEFKAMGYPSLYLYDQRKNLITHLNGYADFEEIKDLFSSGVAAKK
jgi:peroxiredoxin